MHIVLLELSIPPSGIGGAEIQAWELARRLAARHTVSLIVRQSDGETRTEQREGVHIIRIACAPAPFTLVSHIAGYVRAMHTLHRGDRPVDAVIGFRIIPNGLVCAICRGFWKIPACVSIRGLDWYKPLGSRFGRKLLRWVIRHNTRIHTQSATVAHDVLAVSPSASIALIPNGLDSSPLRAAGRDVMYVGGLTPHKGIPILLEAMRMLPHRALTVVGEGPEAKRLRTLATGMNVTFLGQIPPEAVPRLMADRGRVLVLPTVATEGMPNVVMQAMSVGLPVVASAIPGCIDLITDRQSGLLAPPGDPQAMAQAIETLFAEGEPRNTIIRNAIRQTTDYEWPRVLAAWEDTLHNLRP